jgi:TPR repeat protein
MVWWWGDCTVQDRKVRAEQCNNEERATAMGHKKVMNSLLVVLLGVLLYMAWSNATLYGNRAHRAENHRVAKAWYWLAAQSGDARAQNNLAGFYAEGQGGARDDAEAARWFERAAAAGVPAAQFNLSNLYEEGRGVPRDTRKAAALLEELALAGDAPSAFNLGQLYATGRDDFAQNYDQARRWYTVAANKGLASAQYNLGGLYAQGQGVPQDFSAAAGWLLKAAQQNHRKAQMDYGLMRWVGTGVERNREDGQQWLRRAAADPQARQLVQERLVLLCSAAPDAVQKHACTESAKAVFTGP